MSDKHWQHISSAPKDGTTILLYAEAWEMSWGVVTGHFDDGRWHTEQGSVDENEPGFDPEAEVDDDFDPESDRNTGPTHWLPLPASPKRVPATPPSSFGESR